ncbi:platelet glycoprotein IX-like [Varanus komodoensis]|uniref:platelet glycoprotein IX-like n=1 Tax=Varanus komodoensis TaxID=61221 RepID=UPI001CF7B41B|nr:platelet glycoprotein IX-like [Varanus komodoensis]XP_044307379.1 platelet glycoprotein IX-like [Varanus komodoensis]
MVTCRGLLILLFLEAISANSCSHHCVCFPPDHKPVRVNCSFRELTTLPLLPDSTQELYLQGNKLETIPAGAFDNLQMLNIINLSSNLWHCDCGILYLKNWLEDQVGSSDISDIKCFTPSLLHGTSISALKRSELPSCSTPKILCSDFLFHDAFISLFVLAVVLICCVLIAQRMKFTVKICDSGTKIPDVSSSVPDTLRRRRERVSSRSSAGMPAMD